MGRCLTPKPHRWDGPAVEFSPEGDDIPWSFVPDRECGRRMAAEGNQALAEEDNAALCDMVREETIETLNKVLMEVSEGMRNGKNRVDN